MEQIEKEKIQSNKGSSYKLLVEQAKLKQATSKVSSSSHTVCNTEMTLLERGQCMFCSDLPQCFWFTSKLNFKSVKV